MRLTHWTSYACIIWRFLKTVLVKLHNHINTVNTIIVIIIGEDTEVCRGWIVYLFSRCYWISTMCHDLHYSHNGGVTVLKQIKYRGKKISQKILAIKIKFDILKVMIPILDIL